MVEILEVTLDAGESEAIAMSMEWPADLLIMDESSRSVGILPVVFLE